MTQQSVVTFSNSGIIDEAAIKTFGINVKEGENPIGFFGTGLKYAIAIILREGCSIEIYTGGRVFRFRGEEQIVRGKSFQIIHMNDGEVDSALGFTTELGKNWKLWQAFRELHCNAADEGGFSVGDHVSAPAEGTTIYVYGQKFLEIWHRRGEIILDKANSKLVTATESCSVFDMKSKYVFYRGIRIYDSERGSIYTYNIKDQLSISEDRVANSWWELQSIICSTVTRTKEKKFIRKVLLAPSGTLEAQLDFAWVSGEPTPEFIEVAKSHRLSPCFNASVHKLIERWGVKIPPGQCSIDSLQEQQMEKAINFCNFLGYPVRDFPIVVSSDLKDGIFGLAEDGNIYISNECFNQGTKFLVSTLIEEYLHLKTGYADLTRALQTYLFNELVTLGERLKGEPI